MKYSIRRRNSLALLLVWLADTRDLSSCWLVNVEQWILKKETLVMATDTVWAITQKTWNNDPTG